MSTITKEQFLKAVKKELQNIRKYASPSQIARLDINSLRPDEMDGCIYGQMTGDCNSLDAIHLIKLCCEGVLEGTKDRIILNEANIEDLITSNVPKYVKPTKNFDYKIYERRDMVYLSALEVYIMLQDAKLSNVIKYLIGKTNRLKL